LIQVKNGNSAHPWKSDGKFRLLGTGRGDIGGGNNTVLQAQDAGGASSAAPVIIIQTPPMASTLKSRILPSMAMATLASPAYKTITARKNAKLTT
jgi:hypothetical protein